MPDLMPLARAEREDFVELLRDLTPDEWEVASLCEAWTVRDVAAHVYSYDERSWPGTAWMFLRGGLRPGKVNDVALRDYRGSTPEQLVALAERCVEPKGLPAGFGGGIALADGLIHQQDVRRPLGRTREIPPERLAAALTIAMTAPTLPAKGNVKGLRLHATDVGWTHGDGPEVAGPGEALLMAVTGRTVALPELTGGGVAALAERSAR